MVKYHAAHYATHQIGLVLGDVIAIDIVCLDESIEYQAQQHGMKGLGESPMRVGLAPLDSGSQCLPITFYATLLIVPHGGSELTACCVTLNWHSDRLGRALRSFRCADPANEWSILMFQPKPS